MGGGHRSRHPHACSPALAIHGGGGPSDRAKRGGNVKARSSRSALAAVAAMAIALGLSGCGGGGKSSAATTTSTGATSPTTVSGGSTPDSSGTCTTDETGTCVTGDTSVGSQDATTDAGACVDIAGDCTTSTSAGGSSSGSSMSAWSSATSNGGTNINQSTNVQAINAVEKDIGTIGQDFSNGADDTTLGADCDQLTQDSTAFPTPDSPDATVNDNLKKASDYLISGSTDCNVDNQSASTELNKAVDFINTAVGRIKSLGGG